MQAVIDFFSYINGLGASVMMPIILTIFGVILGAKFGKALRGGLTVGVGFIGLNLAVGLIGTYLAPAVQQIGNKIPFITYNSRRRMASCSSYRYGNNSRSVDHPNRIDY